jgi:hypothetical protein
MIYLLLLDFEVFLASFWYIATQNVTIIMLCW